MRDRTITSCWDVAKLTKTKVLRLAAEKLGGARKLGEFLAAPSADIASWLTGKVEPPTPIFMRALDVILNDLEVRDARPEDVRCAGDKGQGS